MAGVLFCVVAVCMLVCVPRCSATWWQSVRALLDRDERKEVMSSVDVLWGVADTHAVVGRYFHHSIAAHAFVGDDIQYSVSQKGRTGLPGWLFYNLTTRAFVGVPDAGDVGLVQIRVVAYTLLGSEAESEAMSTFAIDVRPDHSGAAARWQHCVLDENAVEATLLLDCGRSSGRERAALIQRMAAYLDRDVRSLRLGPGLERPGRSTVLAAGPGDRTDCASPALLSWPAGCGGLAGGEAAFSDVMQRNIGSGRLTRHIGHAVCGWYLTSLPAVRARVRRQAHVVSTRTPTFSHSPSTAIRVTTVTQMAPPTSSVNVQRSSSVVASETVSVLSTSFIVAPTFGSLISSSTELASTVRPSETTVQPTPSVASLQSLVTPMQSTMTVVPSVTLSLPASSTSVVVSRYSPDPTSLSSIKSTVMTSSIRPTPSSDILTTTVQSVGTSDTSSHIAPSIVRSSIDAVMTDFFTSTASMSTGDTQFTATPPLPVVPASMDSFTAITTTVVASTETMSSDPLQSVTSAATPRSGADVLTTSTGHAPVTTGHPVPTTIVSVQTTNVDVPSVIISNSSFLSSSPSLETARLPSGSMELVTSSMAPSFTISYATATGAVSEISTPYVTVGVTESEMPTHATTEVVVPDTTMPDVTTDTGLTEMSSPLVTTDVDVQDTSTPYVITEETSPDISTPYITMEVSGNTTQYITTESIADTSTSFVTTAEAIPDISTTHFTTEDSDMSPPYLTTEGELSTHYVTTEPGVTTDFGWSDNSSEAGVTVSTESGTSETSSYITSEAKLWETSTVHIINETVVEVSTPEVTESSTTSMITEVTTKVSVASTPFVTTEPKRAETSTPDVTASLDTTVLAVQETSTEATTSSFTETTRLPTSGAVNHPPRLVNPLQRLTVTRGAYFERVVPADTFYDFEQGDTRSLALSLRSHGDSWLQLDSGRQVLYGLAFTIGGGVVAKESRFLLAATDDDNVTVYAALPVSVVTTAAVTHVFVMRASLSYATFVSSRASLVGVARRLGAFHGDRAAVVLRVHNGSVVVEWTDRSLSGDVCHRDDIRDVFSRMASNDSVVSEFYAAMMPDFPPVSLELRYEGACAVPARPGTTPAPAAVTARTTWIALLVGAAVVAAIVAAVVCGICVKCRRDEAGRFVPDDDKPIFYRHRKPLMLADELEMKELAERPRKPVLMPDDSHTYTNAAFSHVPSPHYPPLGSPPPRYDSQGRQHPQRPPPLYQLPPVYTEADRKTYKMFSEYE